MKKWLIQSFIGLYLLALSWGIVSHAVSFGTGAHPAMYYIVWDMFCGWTSYSSRNIIIGQGESGKYYELSPGPWGEVQPFGKLGRRHYDVSGAHTPKLALNVLRHTQHEPITRIFVIEECWAKKYNLPDHLWEKQYEEPKDIKKYYQVRHIFTPDGSMVKSYPNWLSLQYSYSVADNPRLMADQRRGQPFFVMKNRSQVLSGTGYRPEATGQVGSRLGNGN